MTDQVDNRRGLPGAEVTRTLRHRGSDPRGVGQTPTAERVVLLDQAGRPSGTALKTEVHHRHTPLHLAFSCWAIDKHGRTLITRRALSKQTWPGVWTNAFCGHPVPGETPSDAVHRRAQDELGAKIAEPEAAIPDFRYRATMSNGVIENEVCPVYVAALVAEPAPNPEEVMDLRWIEIDALAAELGRDRHWFSPWATRQFVELTAAHPVFARHTADRPPLSRARYRTLLPHRRRSSSA